MAKITLEVPDDVAEMFKALEARLKSLEADKTGAAPAVKESEVDVVTSGIALELKRRGLQALEIDTEYVLVDGKRHKRVLKAEATYYAKEGTVRVTRSLFRECGVRNARTVDPVAARMGAVGTWLPEVAKAAAFLLQQGTSREAEDTSKATSVLPFSRSSFLRVAHAVGALHDAVRDEVEDELVKRCVIPDKASSLSVSMDRVAVPMEEPLPRKAGRPKKGAAKRPIARVWHMAYVGTLTFHDAEGNALHTIRYGRMPGLGCDDLLGRLFADTQAFLARGARLKIALLSDGAKEMVDGLAAVFNRETLGVDVYQHIDLCTLLRNSEPQRASCTATELRLSSHAGSCCCSTASRLSRGSSTSFMPRACASTRSATPARSTTPSRTFRITARGWTSWPRVQPAFPSGAATSRRHARASSASGSSGPARAGSRPPDNTSSTSEHSPSAIALTTRWNSLSRPSFVTSGGPLDQHGRHTQRDWKCVV